jgi:hypothetical protein
MRGKRVPVQFSDLSAPALTANRETKPLDEVA